MFSNVFQCFPCVSLPPRANLESVTISSKHRVVIFCQTPHLIVKCGRWPHHYLGAFSWESTIMVIWAL
jgi:hypothetical protein